MKDKTSNRDILPTDFKPVHYDVRLLPGIESREGSVQSHLFHGEVAITIKCVNSADFIEVNSVNLNIERVTLSEISKGKSELKCTEFSSNDETRRLRMKFEGKVPRGATAKLGITYTGTHDSSMDGFYRAIVSKPQDEIRKYMFATQFESNSCSKALPCWDEPMCKATFSVVLDVDEGLVSLSNMEVTETKKVQTEYGPKIRHIYAKTPIMSTYLLAFVVGDLRKISIPEKNGINYNFYAIPDDVQKGYLALEAASGSVDMISKEFGIKYPLNKLDQVCIPEFNNGAMENWGIITYRDTYCLYDPKTSSWNRKKNVTETVAHEVVHQWFGNLVTMKWWNDLWLNESFATYFASYITRRLYPDSNSPEHFIYETFYVIAMPLDALMSTHPVESDVKNAIEVAQVFDEISYYKGCAVLHMVSMYMGLDKFVSALGKYIKAHSYSNATSRDLLMFLKEEAGEDIDKYMTPWILESGFPLVTVTNVFYSASKKTLTLSLSQRRYLSSGEVISSENETIWWIPVSIVTHERGYDNPIKTFFNQKEAAITFDYNGDSPNAFWKINADVSGFYRTLIPEKKHLDNVVSKASSNKISLSNLDRASIVSDLRTLAKSGEVEVTYSLTVAMSFLSTNSHTVVSECTSGITAFSNYYIYDKVRQLEICKPVYRLFAEKLKHRISEVGYVMQENESYEMNQMRSIIIPTLASAEYAPVVEKLTEIVSDYLDGKSSEMEIDSGLRLWALRVYLSDQKSAEDRFEKVFKMYMENSNKDYALDALLSLGSVNSLTCVNKLLNEYVFDGKTINIQHIQSVIRIAIRNTKIHGSHDVDFTSIIWNWFTNSWDRLVAMYKNVPENFGNVFDAVAMRSCNDSEVQRVKDWLNFKDLNSSQIEKIEERKKNLALISMSVKQSMEYLQNERAAAEKYYPIMKKWIQENQTA